MLDVVFNSDQNFLGIEEKEASIIEVRLLIRMD